MPNSHPDSTSSEDNDLPSLAKFLSDPTAKSNAASRPSRVTDVVESDGDSEEIVLLPATGLQI